MRLFLVFRWNRTKVLSQKSLSNFSFLQFRGAFNREDEVPWGR